jgi:hypothetical protein
LSLAQLRRQTELSGKRYLQNRQDRKNVSSFIFPGHISAEIHVWGDIFCIVPHLLIRITGEIVLFAGADVICADRHPEYYVIPDLRISSLMPPTYAHCDLIYGVSTIIYLHPTSRRWYLYVPHHLEECYNLVAYDYLLLEQTAYISFYV